MKIILALAFAFLISVFTLPKAYNIISLQIEKRAIEKPPRFKTLSEVKGMSTSSPVLVDGKYKYPHDYTIVLLGDSMTERLGNADELRGYLNKYYPEKTFEVLNYGFGSTNLLSVYARLTGETNYGRVFRPILDIDFDLIIIESFAHNPLSEYSIEDGLKLQTEQLDLITRTISQKSPRAKIVFLATLGLDKNYAKGSPFELPENQRAEWINEREAYFENHIKYAKEHNLPLIDVYHSTLDSEGFVKPIFIDQADHIHPSPTGVLYLSKYIADFLHSNSFIEKN